MNTKRWLLCLGFPALFIVFRLLLILCSIDLFFSYEELHTGTVIRDFSEGLRYSIFDYQDMDHSGETVFLGLLGIPFYYLFGNSLIATKMSVIMLHAVSLFLLIYLLDLYFDRTVAIMTGLLFVFSPPLWLWITVKPMYQHAECFLFFLLAAHALVRFRENRGNGTLNLVLFGFFNGMGLWYTYSFLVATVSLFLFFFLTDRRSFALKSLIIMTFSAGIGFGLRIYQFLILKNQVFQIESNSVQSYFLNTPLLDSAKRLGEIIFVFLPESFFYSQTLPSMFFQVIIYVAFAWYITRSLRNICPKESLFIIYPVLFLITISISSFEIVRNPDGYRYLAPLYPFIFIIVALFLGELIKHRVKSLRILGVSAFLTLLLFNLYSFSLMAGVGERNDFGKGLQYTGSSQKMFDWLFGIKIGGNVVVDPAALEAIKKQKHTYFFYEQLPPVLLAYGMDKQKVLGIIQGWKSKQHLLFAGLGRRNDNSLSELVPDQILPSFYENFGVVHGFGIWEKIHFWNRNREYYSKLLQDIVKLDRKVPKKYQKYFLQGLGRGVPYSIPGRSADFDKLINNLPTAVRADFAIGLGRSLGWEYGNDFTKKLGLFKYIPANFRDGTYFGFGTECAYDLWDGVCSPEEILVVCSLVPERHRSSFLAGLGVGAKRIQFDDSDLYSSIKKLLPSKQHAFFEKGYQGTD